MRDPPPCPDYQIDPFQVFPWITTCKWFSRCAECLVNESGICRTQGVQVVGGVRDVSAKNAYTRRDAFPNPKDVAVNRWWLICKRL